MKTRLVRKGILAGGLGLLLALALMLTAIPAAAPATAQQIFFMQAIGTVMDCQDPVPADTPLIVTAWKDGVGEVVICDYVVQTAGFYGNCGLAPGCCYIPNIAEPYVPDSGDPMWFYVGGEPALCSTEGGPYLTTSPFQPWEGQEVIVPIQIDLLLPCPEQLCPLTVNHTGTGSTSPSGTANYTCSDNVPITAIQTDLCWEFDYWSVTGGCMVGDVNSASTWIIVSGTCTATAHFVAIDCDYLDNWYDSGDPYTVCEDTQVCTYQHQEYQNYYCSGGQCAYTVTNTREQLIGCTSCDDQDPCTIDTCESGECVHTPIDCDQYDNWYDVGDPYTACNDSQVCTYQHQEYQDYYCSGGQCAYTVNDTREQLIGCDPPCDDQDPCTIDTCENGECVYTPIQYTLTVNSVGDGTTTPSGSANYSCGANVTLLAEPNICNSFDHWSVTGGCTVGDTSSSNTWTIVNGNCTVTAYFVAVEVVYLDSSSTVGGNVTDPGEGIFPYDCCTWIDLVATPDTAYVFDFWESNDVDVDGSTNSTESIHMVTDKWVIAHFASKCAEDCELTVSSTAAGEVTVPGEGTFIRPCGTTVNLIAVPEDGFAFYKWIGDTGTIDDIYDATTTIYLDGDYAIVATFSVWTLDLSQGWNILSTPIALDDCCDTWGEFKAFGDLDVDPLSTTYWFDGYNQLWDQVLAGYELYPCDAIYVKMAHADTAPIIPYYLDSSPSKELYPDWNLISLSALQQLGMGLNSMKVNSALASIYLVTGDLQGYTQVVSPPADQESWYYIRDTVPCIVYMKIGKGYWVFMTNAGTLGGFAFTPW